MMSAYMMNTMFPATKKVNFEQLSQDIVHKRSHPVYRDWKDWKEIAYRYHSAETLKLLDVMNRGKCKHYIVFDFSERNDRFLMDIWHTTSDYIYKLMSGKTFENLWYDFEMNTTCFCECHDVDPACRWFEWHLRVHIISIVWAYVRSKKVRKSFRKYYDRLVRIVMALNEEQLMHFNIELITRPREFAPKGRNILRYLYNVAYFDNYHQDDIIDFVERVKHSFIPRGHEEVDSATEQCGSVRTLFDCLLDVGARLLERYSFLDILSYFRPRQQGLFSVNVNHSLKDSDMSKFKEIFVDTQKSFIAGLADTAIETGQSIAVMFAIAGTVSLLAKRVTGFAIDVIIKVLHIIYSLLFGPTEEQRITASYHAVQQGGIISSLPFLPAMILNYIISPPSDILKKIWSNHNIDLIMRRLGYLGDIKIEKGIERVTEWIKEVIYNVQSWYYREILGVPMSERLDNKCPEIETWTEQVMSVIKDYYEGTYVWSETNWSILYNLYATGIRFTRVEYLKKYRHDVWKIVQQISTLLEKFKSHQRSSQTIRNPPVTIYLAGGSGVGKSTITYPLSVAMLSEIFKREKNTTDLKKYWKSLIYTRAAEQEFWDGYENQLVTVFDDFNQQCDSASNPSLELFEVIRSSNCFPYPLHMANLDQKANTTFTSKIIVVSSNMEKPRTQSLNYPEALLRRFDVCVKVDRKPEFKGVHIDKFDPNIYTFTQYDMQTGSIIQNLTYERLVELCVFEYFSRREFVDSIDSYINDFLDKNSDDDLIDFDTPVQQSGRIADLNLNAQEALMSHQLMYHAMPMLQTAHFERRTEIINPITCIGHGLAWVSTKIRDFINPPDTWQLLLRYCSNLRQKRNEWMEWWSNFKEKHYYLVKSLQIIAMVLTGIMFIKTFMSVKALFSGKKQPKSIMSLGEFVSDWNRNRSERKPSALSEGYSPAVIRPAKVEGYTPAGVKPAKVEAYDQTIIRPAKVESVIYDSKTGLPMEQGVKDLNATEILMSVARRNLYKIYESTNDVPLGHILFIKGKLALMPRHFLYGFEQSLRNDPEATLYFKSILLERGFECHIKDLLNNRMDLDSPDESVEDVPISRDLTAFVVPTAIIHPDVTPHFAKQNTLNYVNTTEVVLPVVVNNNVKNSNRGILMVRYRKGKSVLSRVVDPLPIGNEESRIVRYIRDAWRYECDTQPTECGAPLIVRNTHIAPGKIVGIHVAGIEGTGEGFSTPVYQEDILYIISKFPEHVVLGQRQRVELKEFPQEQGQVPLQAEFIRLGELDKPIFQPKTTTIQPSLCYGAYKEPETKPCQLKPQAGFDPRGYRLARLGNIPKALGRDVIENARDAFLDEISIVIVESEGVLTEEMKPVYSFEEAICGIDGSLYVNSLKRTTSPGFPFVNMPEFSNRKKIFGEGDLIDLNRPEVSFIRKRVSEIISSAKRGEVLDHYFIDTLKDERKPIFKAHKTRLFSAGPLDYLIACKMYFNGAVALLQKTRNWSHVSVGTNPYSEDWSEIARVLKRKSNLMVAGDFEGFDASQHQLLLEAAGEIFIQISVRFLRATPEDVKIMRVLLVSLFNSMHITGTEVYQWTHSLPSGHYLTAPINSVFVNISFGCIWQLAFDNVSYIFARKFWNECGIVAYGDDHILSIPKDKIEIFNQYTIPKYFQLIGLSYTLEDKEAKVSAPSRPLSEINYLKRGFALDRNGKYLAPLSLSTVLETPMWCHKTPDIRAQTIENLEWALKELSLHSEDIWNEWAPKLMLEQQKLGHYTLLRNQYDARNVCLSQQYEM